MGAIGIVAEYNPFHRGHAYHIEQTRRLLGTNKPVICVMSGNWVQRGECALVDKWTRAEMALRGGADLILELPLPWAVSSAERFAQGAIAILKETGVVDTLSFGSESGLVEDLREVAKCLESKAYQNVLHTELDKGISFAEARQRAAVQVIGKKAENLSGANDSLGVEYLRRACDDWKVVAIHRKGVNHDSCCATTDYASASYLRQKLRVGEDVSPWVESVEMLQRADFAKMENIERAILTRLRQMEESDFAALPDSGIAEGFPARLVKAARNANSLEEFYALAKTKRYAHARIRRLAVWAFLGITAADRLATEPAYLRVLGMNERGICLLREMKQKATLPILTKPAHIRNMEENAQRLFALESRGTDFFMLALDAVQPCGKEFTTNPVIL